MNMGYDVQYLLFYLNGGAWHSSLSVVALVLCAGDHILI